MKEITNRFGTGILYDESDLGKNIYCICTACMSVWSDFLSFANEEAVKDKVSELCMSAGGVKGSPRLFF